MFLNYCRSIGWKRFWVMVLGNIFIGLGGALLKLSAFGNDPFNGMDMALSGVTGIPYPVLQIIVNVCLFVFQIIAYRTSIGFGTVVNAVFLGYIISFFYQTIGAVCGIPEGIAMRLITVILGVVVCAFGLSLYQQSKAGIAPYDALAIIMDRKFTRISYFWCRMLADGTCALICFLAGGIVGLGTILTVFGLGPCIQFFDRTFTNKIIFKENTVREG